MGRFPNRPSWSLSSKTKIKKNKPRNPQSLAAQGKQGWKRERFVISIHEGGPLAAGDDSTLTESQIQKIVAEEKARLATIIPIDSVHRGRKKPRCLQCGTICMRHGFDRYSQQRWRCKNPECKRMAPSYSPRLGLLRRIGNVLIPDLKILLLLRLMVEGVGFRASCRIVGVSKNTYTRILRLVGQKCAEFTSQRVVEIPASSVEVDEMWTFVMKKKFHRGDLEKKNHKVGSAWFYIGLDRETRMVLASFLGKRTLEDASEFMVRLRRATRGNFTVYTDGFQPYPTAIYSVFLYNNQIGDVPDFITEPAVVQRNNGTHGPLHAFDGLSYERACTNHVERFNGTLRGQVKRLTRKTQSFSKSWLDLDLHLSLFVCYYNFCRPHAGIEGRTPAMAAGITDKPWSFHDLLTEFDRIEADRHQPVTARIPEVAIAN